MAIGELLDILSKTDPFYVIGYEINLLLTVDQVVEVYNSGMVESFETCNFPLACLFLHRILQFELIVDLNRVLLLISLV